ncbi:hypothetical protein LXL04_019024 [Taraxacum kok-saghyz]
MAKPFKDMESNALLIQENSLILHQQLYFSCNRPGKTQTVSKNRFCLLYCNLGNKHTVTDEFVLRTLCYIIPIRLDGMGGIRPAVCHLAEFTAGVGGGMAFSSGKLCQRPGHAGGFLDFWLFTSAKLYLPLYHKSLPAANSPKSENILRVAYVAQFASANFTYHTDQSNDLSSNLLVMNDILHPSANHLALYEKPIIARLKKPAGLHIYQKYGCNRVESSRVRLGSRTLGVEYFDIQTGSIRYSSSSSSSSARLKASRFRVFAESIPSSSRMFDKYNI